MYLEKEGIKEIHDAQKRLIASPQHQRRAPLSWHAHEWVMAHLVGIEYTALMTCGVIAPHTGHTHTPPQFARTARVFIFLVCICINVFFRAHKCVFMSRLCDMSAPLLTRAWMRHGTYWNTSWHTYESWHIYEYVKACATRLPHTWISHGTYLNTSWHTYESWHTHDWIMSRMWMSHGTRMDESCHIYEWVVSHTYVSVLPVTHIYMNHCTHESWHTLDESYHLHHPRT